MHLPKFNRTLKFLPKLSMGGFFFSHAPPVTGARYLLIPIMSPDTSQVKKTKGGESSPRPNAIRSLKQRKTDIFSILHKRRATRQRILKSLSASEQVTLLKRSTWVFGSEAEERRDLGQGREKDRERV